MELLDRKAMWARIKSGFTGGKLYMNIPAQPKRTFVDGIAPEAREAQGMTMTPKSSVFGGKTFKDRK